MLIVNTYRSEISVTSVNSLTPNLMVEDVESTVEWYERVFNAELVATLPPETEDYWWAQVMVDGNAFMLQRRENSEKKLPKLEGASLGGSVAFYIDIDDAQDMHDRLESADVENTQDLHETEYGWPQFAAKDYNGYVLWFGERIEDASEEIGRGYRVP